MPVDHHLPVGDENVRDGLAIFGAKAVRTEGEAAGGCAETEIGDSRVLPAPKRNQRNQEG